MKKTINFIVILILTAVVTFSAEFNVKLVPFNIENLTGVQSYAFGQSGDYLVVLGGRLDGLHRRQPVFSFDVAGMNKQILIINLKERSFVSVNTENLHVKIREQISTTNIQFHQTGDYLYLIGGYGFSQTAGSHITFSGLISVNLPGLIESVNNNADISSNFKYLEDEMFSVTGGYLEKIDSVFYLVGGHKFTGRYNPSGGPSFKQEYTNQIRKFTIYHNNDELIVNHIEQLTDSTAFHRRDYNVVAQIMPDGEHGLTAFSGVFRPEADIPYLSCVEISDNGYKVRNDFSQYLNHYHCAHAPLYDEINNEMHTIFFGGIAQYFYEDGILVQDDNVPFVNTIAAVTRYSDNSLRENKLNTEMPGLFGASAEFIINQNLTTYSNGVINLNVIPSDTALIGYIFGGINSSEPNIFFTDDGTKSHATSNFYEVYLIKNSPNSFIINEQSTSSMQMQLFPMPGNGTINFAVTLQKSGDLKISISDLTGKMLVKDTIYVDNPGRFLITKFYDSLINSGTYIITAECNDEICTQMYIFER